ICAIEVYNARTVPSCLKYGSKAQNPELWLESRLPDRLAPDLLGVGELRNGRRRDKAHLHNIPWAAPRYECLPPNCSTTIITVSLRLKRSVGSVASFFLIASSTSRLVALDSLIGIRKAVSPPPRARRRFFLGAFFFGFVVIPDPPWPPHYIRSNLRKQLSWPVQERKKQGVFQHSGPDASIDFTHVEID